MNDFETWWHHEGSAFRPVDEDVEEFAKRMCKIAWSNGAFKAEEELNLLYIERNHARTMYRNAVKILVGIDSLLYPPAKTLPDGRVMVFRPSDPDPHTILQALSDRIRAIPDELAAIASAKEAS